ncbi:hypothetical protein NEIRO03_2405 [Nematocida sp. AWRm78]|nr:hypothetical protein NEIRO02_2388 [Nematocida sp. AWRm79]KAI5186865.1 hypothetical protein NEIRO03_2405 [Nematocida sp. AWRm78]
MTNSSLHSRRENIQCELISKYNYIRDLKRIEIKNGWSHSKNKRTVVEYAILILSIICINIRPIQTSVAPSNASALDSVNTLPVQAQKGVFNSLHAINSTASDREDSIRYVNNVLQASVQKYNENTIDPNSTEQPKRKLKVKRQIIPRNNQEYVHIIKKFESNFKNITGSAISDCIYVDWPRGVNWLKINSYRIIIIEQEYFENLIQNFVINRSKKNINIASFDPIHVYQKKIVNVPILSARMHEYYPFVKKDFKNIIKAYYKLENPDRQIDPFEEYAISEEQLAEMFMEVNKSPDMYKNYYFGNITMYNNSKTYISKIVGQSSEKVIVEALDILKDDINRVQIELTKFIGGMFNEIEKYIKGVPEFNVTNQILYGVFMPITISLDLSEDDESTSKLIITRAKTMWKFTNLCFIYQLSGVFDFIKKLSNIEMPKNLKYLNTYLQNYKGSHATGKNQYFSEVLSIIKEAEIKINSVNTSNDDMNEINGMFKELQSLGIRAMQLLDLIIESFKNDLEEIEEYITLSIEPSIPGLLQNNKTSFYNIQNEIESWVEYVWRIAKYADEYIGLTDEEKALDKNSYNMALIKKLSIIPEILFTLPTTITTEGVPSSTSITNKAMLYTTTEKAASTPSYTSKAGQITFNMLLAVSAAGTYVLQKIFFLR